MFILEIHFHRRCICYTRTTTHTYLNTDTNSYTPPHHPPSVYTSSGRWWLISYVFKARITVGTRLLLKLVLLHTTARWEKDEKTMEWGSCVI